MSSMPMQAASRVRLSLVAAIACALAAPLVHAAPMLAAVAVREVAPSATGRYLVTFAEAGHASYGGEVPGLAGTAPAQFPKAQQRLDLASAAARQYGNYLRSRRSQHLGTIGHVLGRRVDTARAYEVTRHAVSLELSPDEAARIATLPGIAAVEPVAVQQLQTYRGPSFVGAPAVWDGSAVPGGIGTRGEGVRIGVIDSGADAAHPSFADDASCGFAPDHPKLVAHDCNASDGVRCTGIDPRPDEGIGHGMHVASTAAGNRLVADVVPAPLLPAGTTLTGVAPCASVVSYKACGAEGCYSDVLLAAVQHAIADELDVINFSIGPRCGGGDPWNDGTDFRAAVAAGTAVIAAAGNTSADCADPVGRASNLGPWLTTVAASTHDMLLGPVLEITGPGVPADVLRGVGLVPGSATLPTASTSDFTGRSLRLPLDNPTGCNDSGGIEAGFFDGAVALLQRGACNFSEKIVNAAAAGADFIVIVNNVESTLSMDTTGAPADVAAFSVPSLAASNALLDFARHPSQGLALPGDVFIDDFERRPEAIATYRRQDLIDRQPDVIGDFSLRGPIPAPFANLAKPDIAAPGVGIYAASDPASGDYEIISGTSMASPHVAGATVLLRALQPTWSPDEVKSALLSTAVPDGHREDGVAPWTPEDVGSGRLDIAAAVAAGLTLDETLENYNAADPTWGSLPISALNLPSLRELRCGERCSFERTVRNRLPVAGSWSIDVEQTGTYTVTVEPAQFTLEPGEQVTLAIDAQIVDVTRPAELGFGRLWLREHDGLAVDQHWPLALRGDEASVDCVGDYCNFRIDGFSGAYNAAACIEDCDGFFWANRFSPPLAAFPIRLTSVTFLTGSSSYVSAGDVYDIHVYQDDDRDPANGAVLVDSHLGYTIGTAGARLREVAFDAPVVLDGPGDVIVAITRASGTGSRPAAGEASADRRRSYVGSFAGDAHDLAGAGLLHTGDVLDAPVNWVIRASGTTGAGKSIVLGEVTR